MPVSRLSLIHIYTCPALALPGLALAAAVPTAWAAWALLAEPPDGLPPEQLLEQDVYKRQAHHQEEHGVDVGPHSALLQVGQQEQLFYSQQHKIVQALSLIHI